MKIFKKHLLWLNVLGLLLVLAHSIRRDIHLDNQYPSDLRNRLIGARMQKDGLLPYNFFDVASTPIRYFDPVNFNKDSTGVSRVTASPFFHELLIPFCELPQRTFSRAWLISEYLFLAAMICMICRLTKNNPTRWMIVNVGVLFTLTEAWKLHIDAGQIYLFEAFLLCLIFYILVRNKKRSLYWAGLFAAIFFLTRFYGAALFLPFFINFKKYRFFIVTAAVAIFLYGLFAVFNPYERALYRNYFQGVAVHVKQHQDPIPWKTPTPKTRIVLNLEGFDFDEVKKDAAAFYIDTYNEAGNVFEVYHKITGSYMPLIMLNIFGILTVLLIAYYFLLTSRKSTPKNSQVILLGSLLYMIAEMFSPIHRFQYNTVQFFPMVLSCLLFIPVQRSFLIRPSRRSLVFWLMIAGLLLNMCNWYWLKMRHTLGEFCWITGILLIVFDSKPALYPDKKDI